MQTLKITIRGSFWDTQLYKDVLYVFELDGAVRLVNWPALVEGLPVPDRCRLAMEWSFLRSDYLYGNKWDRLFQDQEIQALLASKFSAALHLPLEVDGQMLDQFTVDRDDSPFPYAPNDTLFYKDHLYAVSQSGVYSQFMSGETVPRNRADRSWEAAVSGLDVNLDVLALAAGDEGLFRSPSATYDLGVSLQPHAEQVSQQLCNDCSYVRSSILSSAHETGATLAEFRAPKRSSERSEEDRSREFWEAKPLSVIKGDDLFQENTAGSFCWGSRDRICMAKDGVLTVIKYLPFNDRRRNLTKPVREIPLHSWKGSPVSGDNAVFGAILELDNALVVVRSDDQVDTFRGEPVNWRVFHRSKHCENQLHVVYEDRIEILSFNHDYFVDQKTKSFGEPHN